MFEGMNQLVTKRHEYISEVIAFTKDLFIDGVRRIYTDTLKINRSKRFILRDFQNQLKAVAVWTDDKLKEEVERFAPHDVATRYDLRRMLHNIHVLTIKVFVEEEHHAAVMHEKVPSAATYPIAGFVKDVYLSIARELWRKPHLLYDKLEKHDVLKNMRDLEKLVVNNIKSSIRRLVPLDQIKEHLGDDESFVESKSEDGSLDDVDVRVDRVDEQVADTFDHPSVHQDEEFDVLDPRPLSQANSVRSSAHGVPSVKHNTQHSDDDEEDVVPLNSAPHSRRDSQHSSMVSDTPHEHPKKVIVVDTESESESGSYNSDARSESYKSYYSGSESSIDVPIQKKKPVKALDAYKNYIKLNQVQYLINKKKMNSKNLF